MTGLVAIWSGAIVDIPAGWILCDGNNGTPDLRNEFIVGAGDTYAIDDSGGATSHDHDFTSDGHTHQGYAGNQYRSWAPNAGKIDSQVLTGTTDAETAVPPYFALAYIMFKGQS